MQLIVQKDVNATLIIINLIWYVRYAQMDVLIVQVQLPVLLASKIKIQGLAMILDVLANLVSMKLVQLSALNVPLNAKLVL